MHKKVMVIDDVKLDGFLARQVITKSNFSEEIIVVESASEGLHYLLARKNTPTELPDIIFLDIQMPEMNGFDFLDRFEELPEDITHQCNIIMLTSSIDPKDFNRASKRKHVKNYLIKPLNKEKLENLA